MKCSTAVKAIVFAVAAMLVTASAPRQAAAQMPLGAEITLCSKLNPRAAPVKGVLISNPDSSTYRLHTDIGEINIRRADFSVCNASAPPAPACPAGQIAGAGGCACPASQTMKDGQCVNPPQIVIAAKPKTVERCEKLVAHGSSTLGLGAMPYLIQAFANVNGFQVTRSDDLKTKTSIYQLQGAGGACFQVEVFWTGSDDAIPALTDNNAQLGLSSRILEDNEIKRIADAAKRGVLQRSEIEHVAGLDAVVVTVSRRSSVGALSLCQIAKTFSGEIKDWRELGARPGPIHVHVRMGTSGTFDTFQQLVMKPCGFSEPRLTGSQHSTYAGALEAVAADEMAIGFAPLALVTDKVTALRIGGDCGIELGATPFSVKTEDYPLSRRLFVLAPFALDDYSRKFVEFLTADDRAEDAFSLALPAFGDAGEAEIQHGATSLKIEALADDHAESLNTAETGSDPQSAHRFRELVGRAKRLSVTYRFNFGSEELDVKARQDIRRLARYLQKNPGYRTVLLLGFTDKIGNVGANLELAKNRAVAVRDELIALGADAKRIETVGLGKILPVACNSGKDGKDDKIGEEKNRRVEVWQIP